MLYHLFKWFQSEGLNFPGINLLDFITVRVLLAVLLSLLITMVYGKKLIQFLHKKQVGESVRDLGLAGEQSKKGIPTMGGIIIILGIIIPTLLFARLDTVYIIHCHLASKGVSYIPDHCAIHSSFLANMESECSGGGLSIAPCYCNHLALSFVAEG